MENKKIRISKKTTIMGDDGYKTFSIRIKEGTVQALNRLALETKRSRNELINLFLEYGLENYEIVN